MGTRSWLPGHLSVWRAAHYTPQTGSLHFTGSRVTDKPYSLHRFHKISLFCIHSSTVATSLGSIKIEVKYFTGHKGGQQTALLRLGHCTRCQRNPSRFRGSLHTISLFHIHSETVAGPNLCPDEGSVCSVYSLVSWFKPLECCTWN